jgi:ribosome biogenesis GTPase
LGTELQETRDVRQVDSKGKHTTTRRELFLLPDGGILIDTPGMREFEPWSESGDLSVAFDDIDRLAKACKFGNCQHMNESHCAVKEAIASGALSENHYQNYLKIKREMDYQQSLADPDFAQERKRQNKIIHRSINRMKRKPGNTDY